MTCSGDGISCIPNRGSCGLDIEHLPLWFEDQLYTSFQLLHVMDDELEEKASVVLFVVLSRRDYYGVLPHSVFPRGAKAR